MINGKIDLRSDTVTLPTAKMRQAMFEAVVGDDVYGDDITINELQELAAKMLGKEAALFVPSGTMCNQLALFTHIQRGEEVILPDDCHIVAHEAGASAIISGAQLRCIQSVSGEMPLDILERSIRKDLMDIHQPRTALITYENADSCGQVRTLEYMKQVKGIADKYGLPIHLDGARLFNAALVLGVDVKEMAVYADSVAICLSKGLCAPAGSLLVGTHDFIEKARRKRKILGGGMRQVGILAAAGIVALEEMIKRLADDHENARYMAERLAEIPGLLVHKELQQINMLFFELKDYKLKSQELISYLAKSDIVIKAEEDGMMRFVTHNYISREEVDKVVALMMEV